MNWSCSLLVVLLLFVSCTSTKAQLSPDYVSFLLELTAGFSGWDVPVNTSDIDWCSYSFITCGGNAVTTFKFERISDTLFGTIPDVFDKVDSSFIEFVIKDQEGVHGSLPPSLFNAPGIQIIEISKTNITGEVPNTVPDSLTMLILSDNMLTGLLPECIGDETGLLTTIMLDGNNFHGPLTAISSIVTDLRVQNNALSGSLDALATALELKMFDAAFNFFTSIPDRIGPKLEHLELHNNNISGTIPLSFPQSTTLSTLRLDDNNLSGWIPSIPLSSNLNLLLLQNNKLTGTIPKHLLQGQLTHLFLSNNLLYGSIPPVANTKLANLFLENNFLSLCPDETTFINSSSTIKCDVKCNLLSCSRCNATYFPSCSTCNDDDDEVCPSNRTLPAIFEPPSLAPIPSTFGDIKPIRQCVRELPNDEGFITYFGYINEGAPRTIPTGVNNRVWPPPIDRHGVTDFKSGSYGKFPLYAFSLNSTSNDEFIRWIIGNQTSADGPPNSFISVVSTNDIDQSMLCPTQMNFSIVVKGQLFQSDIEQILANIGDHINPRPNILSLEPVISKRQILPNWETLEGMLDLSTIANIDAANALIGSILDPDITANTQLQIVSYEQTGTQANEEIGGSFLEVPTPAPPIVPSQPSTSPPTTLSPSDAATEDNNERSRVLGGVLGGISSVIIVILLVIIIFLYFKYRQTEDEFRMQLSQAYGTSISYDDVKVYTETLGKWVIPFKDLNFGDKSKPLGAGMFGTVYKGTWRHTTVAIKTLNEVIPDELEPFMQEALLMMDLRPHSNVVQIYGMCWDPCPIIVLEFMSGGSLSGLLKDRALTNIELHEIIAGIAAGMLHLHHSDIVHRDLAARNILLTDGNVPKISDFGMSRLVMEQSGEASHQTVSTLLPIAWMSPQAVRNQWTKKSDVWAFGIVIWECVTQKNPSKSFEIHDLALKIAGDGYHPPIPENTSIKMKQLMNSCWQREPEDRPDFNEIALILDPKGDEENTLSLREITGTNKLTKYETLGEAGVIEDPKDKKGGKVYASGSILDNDHVEPSPKTKRKKSRISSVEDGLTFHVNAEDHAYDNIREPVETRKKSMVSAYGTVPTNISNKSMEMSNYSQVHSPARKKKSKKSNISKKPLVAVGSSDDSSASSSSSMSSSKSSSSLSSGEIKIQTTSIGQEQKNDSSDDSDDNDTDTYTISDSE